MKRAHVATEAAAAAPPSAGRGHPAEEGAATLLPASTRGLVVRDVRALQDALDKGTA